MDFLKDIVKEIGDEYTSSSDIDDTETYVDTGSFLTDLFQGLYLVVYLGIRLRYCQRV